MIIRFFVLTKAILLVAFVLFSVPFLVSAEENLQEICQIEKIEAMCQSIEPGECRKLLEKCEEYYANESAKIQSDLTKTEKEKNTLKNQISSLQKKVTNLTYQINQSNFVIKDLKLQLTDTQGSIEKTASKIDDSREKLASVLQGIYQQDQASPLEVLLTGSKMSDFYDNLMALEILNAKSRELLQNIKVLKQNLEGHKVSLDDEKNDLENVVKIQTLQKIESDATKKEQEVYLRLTEQEYQKQLSQKQETDKKAAAIRARIFELIGVPKAPTFGEAVEIAKYASNLTGIRPAFLLAVLTQESNLGQNVGQCYLKNTATGEGIRVSNNRVEPRTMNPTRDVPVFLEVTREVGRDPLSTLVSCPMSFGWGGAMGPAQFIPSTWAMYKNRVKEILGRPADPWNINDAFLAAALYLSDYGAKQKNYDGEWRAAMIYFAGSVNIKYRFYGDSVIKITKQYEEDMRLIGN